MVKGLIFCSMVIFTACLFWIFDFSILDLKQHFKENLECFIGVCFMYGLLISALLFKSKRQQLGLESPKIETQESRENEKLEKLQENIVVPQKESSVTIQKIKDIAPKKDKSWLQEVLEYMDSKKFELAISKSYEKLSTAKNEKTIFLCRFILYFAYIDCKNDSFLDDTIDNLKKFIPLVKKYEKNDQNLYWEARYNLMVAYARQDKFEDIKREIYDFIIAIRNNPKISADTKFRGYKMLATIYLKENNISYAMGYFDKARQYCKNSFDILFNMALICHYMNNDLDKCLDYINLINITEIEDDKKYERLITMKCYCLTLKKDYYSAYQILDNYLKFSKKDSKKLKGYKAYIAYKLNKFDEAKELSDEVLSSIPDATSTNVRGMLLLEKEKYEDAYENLQSLISSFIDEDKYFLGEIYYHCSYACLKLGKIEDAINYFDKAKETSYNDFDGDYIVDLDIARQSTLPLNKKKELNNN